MASKDPTFIQFTPAQARAYAQGRGSSYPPPLYDALLAYHTGPKNTHRDIGTGPGKVVFDLKPHFTTSIGTDTSAGMIEEARKAASALDLSSCTFAQAAGEECAADLPDGEGSVDVITAAMSAHWLQLPAFYASAAKALRPGGTLAIWTCTSLYAHPSMPNAARVQAVVSELEDGALREYHNSGTALTRAAYQTLDLPWKVSPSVDEFDEGSFVRQEWDKGGIPSADGGKGPFLHDREVSVEDLGRGLASASSVIRWREAHSEKAGGEKDPVVVAMKGVRDALGGGEMMRDEAVTAMYCDDERGEDVRHS
ncbi:uncharacterized protein LTR77_003286 [Saxophila tyrrhenica]|uniref:Methyltransferase type 11 domain-containing protein n=1 Tax=Saxophila tyrrhenica TaxID=1690608 RepID=A0AAV9PJS5_9PEZI|nr:hypothetical protein LTR77_003286 [Saxophila tyrrhenica]